MILTFQSSEVFTNEYQDNFDHLSQVSVDSQKTNDILLRLFLAPTQIMALRFSINSSPFKLFHTPLAGQKGDIKGNGYGWAQIRLLSNSVDGYNNAGM